MNLVERAVLLKQGIWHSNSGPIPLQSVAAPIVRNLIAHYKDEGACRPKNQAEKEARIEILSQLEELVVVTPLCACGGPGLSGTTRGEFFCKRKPCQDRLASIKQAEVAKWDSNK